MFTYPTPLQAATVIQRYKRFFVDVELDSGDVVTAHCPNSGSMRSCLEAGWRCWVSYDPSPKRKLSYTLQLVDNGVCLIGVNTMLTNKIVGFGLQQKAFSELADFDVVEREKKYGDSRLDFMLTNSNSKLSCFVEVKSVSLKHDDMLMFPDAVTTRGQKHLRELAHIVESGMRGVLLFLAQRSDAHTFTAARHIDPTYAELLQEVQQRGVEVLCYGTQISPKGITVGESIPVTSEVLS